MSEVYKFEVNDDDNPSVYSFCSIGKRDVRKIISMQSVAWHKGVVNIVLADEISPNETDAEINTNNGDIYSVLKTCGEIIRHYSEKHPTHAIYIKGADSRREKTYQRLLLRHVNEFLILARETATSEFVPIEEGVNYTGFLIIRGS